MTHSNQLKSLEWKRSTNGSQSLCYCYCCCCCFTIFVQMLVCCLLFFLPRDRNTFRMYECVLISLWWRIQQYRTHYRIFHSLHLPWAWNLHAWNQTYSCVIVDAYFSRHERKMIIGCLRWQKSWTQFNLLRTTSVSDGTDPSYGSFKPSCSFNIT